MRDPSESRASRPRWLAAIESCAHLLGAVDDRVVAARAGLSLPIVRAYRIRRGIRAATLPCGRGELPHDPIDPHAAGVLDDNAHRVGQEPDWMLARELGLTVAAIEAWRSARSGAFDSL